MGVIKAAPHGSWKSPISADLIVAETVALGQVVLDGDDLYWSETRPTEGGRNAIVRRSAAGDTSDVLPFPFNARTRVHEYGGGAYTVTDGIVYFSNYSDQRLYRMTIDPTAEPKPVPLTPTGGYRFADFIVDSHRSRLISVCEDHGHAACPSNTIVTVNMSAEPDEPGSGGDAGIDEIRVLLSGNDFYSTPRISPDGSQMAWLTWNHPNMPWDGTELWLADLTPEGEVAHSRRIAGGNDESIFQPVFSPDGVLYFISDRDNWWNLCRWSRERRETVYAKEAEFGLPQWQFGMSTYAFESDRRLVCTYNKTGTWSLAVIDTNDHALEDIETPYTDISFVNAAEGFAVVIAGSTAEPPALVRIDLTNGRREVLRRSAEVEVGLGYLSSPEAIAYSTSDGDIAHAFFYPPHNRDFQASHDVKPPLLVFSHGGPTAAATGALNLKTQYWTSRGFAVLDVNYRGSTGFGRDYRRRLHGRWGVADVEDCINGAKYLVDQGWVDGERLAIRGSSAGGYTTLCALVFHDTFKAGASYYGVSDLEALAQETHKFEARYLDRLIGPYPQQRDLYRQRSPLQHIDRLTSPVIFFQGLEDEVVPPDQAEQMVQALRAKGMPVAYIPFAEERHGFRYAENIKCALENELFFYSRIFGFQPGDAIAPVTIENL